MLVPAGVIAERLTAAWIFGACPEPHQHQFCVDTAARQHVPISTRFRLREARNVAADTQLIGGIRVTTPRRTVVDLARTRGAAADFVPVLAELFELFPELSTAVLAAHPLLADGRQFRGLAWHRIGQARGVPRL